MKYNFDEPTSRYGMDSIKWEQYNDPDIPKSRMRGQDAHFSFTLYFVCDIRQMRFSWRRCALFPPFFSFCFYPKAGWAPPEWELPGASEPTSKTRCSRFFVLRLRDVNSCMLFRSNLCLQRYIYIYIYIVIYIYAGQNMQIEHRYMAYKINVICNIATITG